MGYMVDRADIDLDQAMDIEVGVFNWAITAAQKKGFVQNWKNSAFRMLYESKARSVACNLERGGYVNNTRLQSRIAEGEFDVMELANMQPAHMFPERWHAVVEAKVRRDEYITNAKPTAVTDQFRCGRCKRRECTYMELQTRSCDEPASLFVQCIACGHHWRMG